MDSRLDSRRVAKFGVLTLVAVGGSLIFGAAAGAVLASISTLRGAALLTLSTGCSWVLFGALLCLVTRRPPLNLAEACLITMAYGEAILVSGALLDFGLLSSHTNLIDPGILNGSIVLVSNIVMAAVLNQLSPRIHRLSEVLFGTPRAKNCLVPFSELDAAQAFLKYKPAGISVNRYGVDVLRITRDESAWRSKLVHVEHADFAFLKPFDATLEVCYEVEPVHYRWNRAERYLL